MKPPARAKRVTILIGQSGHGKQNYLRVLGHLHAEGATGVAAFKAIAAFDAQNHLQTTRLADVAPDLPVMIVWIDRVERVDRILPHLQTLVTEGLITVEDTEMVLSSSAVSLDLPPTVTVADIMTRPVVTVHPDTPMSEVVADLVQRQFRAVPVVDANHRVVGMVTNGDLVQRGGLPVRLELLQTFDTPELHDQLHRLAELHWVARDVMTAPVVTIASETTVRQAAEVMRQRKLKRLPVVDADGVLIGIVSRVDLLCTIASSGPAPPEARRLPHVEGTAPISTVMSTAIPAVGAGAPLSEVINVVTSTRLNRAVVVDAARRPIGIISATQLLERLTPGARPGLRAMLMRRVPFVHGSEQDEAAMRQATAQVAADVMLTGIVPAREEQPIRDVLADMLQSGRKIVPIVNAAGELSGIVDRADLLGVLIQG